MFKLVQLSFCTLAVLLIFFIGSAPAQTQTPVTPTTRPSTDYSVPGLGTEIPQGTGVAFVNLDSDPRPEMFLMGYQTFYPLNNPAGAKYFFYRIGWNLNASGVATSWPGFPTLVPGVGSEAQGAGMAFVNLDSDPRSEMVLMAYNDVSGTKVFRYKIGWNVGTNGVATSWGSTNQVPGVGTGAYGAGLAFANLDSNLRPEIILMAYDNSTGTKNLRYKIGWNVSTSGVATNWSPVYQVAGISPEVQTQGAGMAFVNLDSDPRPEMVLMANEKSQLGGSFCEYMIGRNISTGGVAASWDAVR